MTLRITLSFDHPPCGNVGVDIRIPMPNPIEESAEAIADRYRPECPICAEPARYVGFSMEPEHLPKPRMIDSLRCAECGGPTVTKNHLVRCVDPECSWGGDSA